MTNETKQSAVESIKTTFFHYAEPYPYFSDEEKWVITKEELFELLDKAKEMEKEQNENYLKAYFEWHKSMGFISHKPEDISEFNETYKRR